MTASNTFAVLAAQAVYTYSMSTTHYTTHFSMVKVKVKLRLETVYSTGEERNDMCNNVTWRSFQEQVRI